MSRKQQSSMFDTLDSAQSELLSATLEKVKKPGVDLFNAMPQPAKASVDEQNFYNAINDENKRLFEQNSLLTEKIDEYLSELSVLREQNNLLQTLSSDNCQLQMSFEKLKHELVEKTSENQLLKQEITKLCADNRLKLTNISESALQQKNQISKSTPIRYQPQRTNMLNGYDTWN